MRIPVQKPNSQGAHPMLPSTPGAPQNGQAIRWNNAAQAFEFFTPAVGVPDHDTLGNLGLASCGHTGTAYALWMFDNAGNSAELQLAEGDLIYGNATPAPALLTMPASSVRDDRVLDADSGLPAWVLHQVRHLKSDTWAARGDAATFDTTSSLGMTAEAGGSAASGNDSNGMYSRRTSGAVGASACGGLINGADGRFDCLEELWIAINTGNDLTGTQCYFLGYEDNASGGMTAAGVLLNDHICVRHLVGTDAGWVVDSSDGAAQAQTALLAIAASTFYVFRLTPIASGANGWRVRVYSDRGLGTLTKVADVTHNTRNPTSTVVGRPRWRIATNGNARRFDAYLLGRVRK